jgi:NADPH:quinone reductase
MRKALESAQLALRTVRMWLAYVLFALKSRTFLNTCRTMKAAYIHQPCPADGIIYGDLPTPRPSSTQCLVKVGAVSVNPVDTYVRSGQVEMPLPSPFIVGCDLAGTVIEVGQDVTMFHPGDRVWGTNQGLLGRQGTFAEEIVVDASWLYPTPPEVKDEAAAALALVGITAHLGLVRDAQVRPGETVFVNGGSGGVGSVVIQMAKVLGARVIATAGGQRKAALCQELGADHVIDYKAANVDAELKRIAPAGVNVWWETLREPDFDRTIGALSARGRMVLMAGRESRPPFPVGPFYVKGCSIHGFVMFLATPEEQRACAEDMNRWMRLGRLKANIDRVMPLSETASAHRLQEENTLGKAGTVAGKIVLTPEPS